MANLDVFFKPSSIAVIGASRNPSKIGYSILENVKHSFKGEIYPINPNATEILGLEVFPSINDVEEKIDLAVIAVPSEMVFEMLSGCIKKKIRGAIIISSGFREIGEKQRELKLEKLKNKIRIIGPNCIGTFVPNELDMLFLDRKKLKRPSEGSIGFITHSGAVGSALLDMASNEGVGISKFASIGNRIDVDEVDLLEYLGKDVETRCIVLYLESTERGSELINVAKKIKKPIIALKAGKTEKGGEAVVSHTGALAGSGNIYSTAFRQAGIIETNNIEDIFDCAKALSTQPVLKGKKIAILTNGGGLGIITTDLAIDNGLEIAELSKETSKALKKVLPSYASPNNPVDITGDADTARYEKAIEILMKDKEIDGVICITLFQTPTLEDDIIEVLKDSKMYGKPFIVCATGGEYTFERAKKLERFGVPVYSTPQRAVKAMRCLLDYGKVLKR